MSRSDSRALYLGVVVLSVVVKVSHHSHFLFRSSTLSFISRGTGTFLHPFSGRRVFVSRDPDVVFDFGRFYPYVVLVRVTLLQVIPSNLKRCMPRGFDQWTPL